MEWGSSSQCLQARTGSPYPCPDCYLWQLRWIGEHHAEGQPDFPALISLPHLRICSPVCLTRHRSSSTRTHASGFHQAFSWVTHAPTGGWTLPVLLPITTWGPVTSDPHIQRWVLFSQNLSFPHFPCSQYNYSLQSIPLQPPPLWTRDTSGNICRMSHTSASPVSCPGAPSRNDINENRLDVGIWVMRPLLWGWRSVCCMKRRSHSWYWRHPLWTSSWEAPGSPFILQRSDGTPVRWFAGANSPVNTALRNFHVHSTSQLSSRSLSHGLRPWAQYHSLCHIWLCGIPGCLQQAGSHPPNYHLIGHGTVPSACCLEINSLRVEYTRGPSRSARLWWNASRRLLTKD